MRKALAILLVVGVAVVLSEPAQPQAVGVGVGPTYQNTSQDGGGGPIGEFEQAIALYTFNDANDYSLEHDDRRVPYALDSDGSTAQGVDIADAANISGGQTFTYCGWVDLDAAGDDDHIAMKDDYSTAREWNLRMNGLSNISMYAVDGCSGTAGGAPSVAVNTTGLNLICGRYNHSTGKYSTWANGTLGGDSAATITMCDSAQKLNIGRPDLAGDSFDGRYGTQMFFNALLTDGEMDTLYAEQRRCADVDPTIKAKLVSCWDLDEDPAGGTGAYKDRIGTNDGTPVGSPGRVAPGLTTEDRGGDPTKYLVASLATEPTVAGDGYAVFDAGTDTAQNVNVVNNAASMSFSAWVWRTANPSANAWFGTENVAANPGHIEYILSSGAMIWMTRSDTGGPFVLNTSVDIGSSSGWVHVCGYVTLGGVMSLRVNGATTYTSAATSGNNILNAPSGIHLGAAKAGGNPYRSNTETAYLDDYALWNINIGVEKCDAIYDNGRLPQ